MCIAGCFTYQHRQIVYTVELVLHVSAFPAPPEAGQVVQTNPPMQFCAGDGSPCSPAALKV